MTVTHATWSVIHALSTQCGFTHVSVLPAARITGVRPNAQGAQGIADDPKALLPEAKSVLVASMPFDWYAKWPNGEAEVSAYYLQSHKAHGSIERLASCLREMGVRVASRQQLPLKLLGQRAGVGVIGRNTLLRNEAWGSCFVMQSLVTDMEPEEDPQPVMRAVPCGKCRLCVDACPTGALDGEGKLDTSLCLRTYMMHGLTVPQAFREKMGLRLLGCEICQRVCPVNCHIPCAEPPLGFFSIDTLLIGERQALIQCAHLIGRNDARQQRLQSQAAIAAGNSGDRAYCALLEKLKDHARPAIAEHAGWALNRLKGD